MSFEETLVCDGCSRVVGGGTRGELLDELRNAGGRSFVRNRRGVWDEVRPDSVEATRHLAADCCGTAIRFYDGERVPLPSEGTER